MPKNKDILMHHHSTVIHSNNLTQVQYFSSPVPDPVLAMVPIM